MKALVDSDTSAPRLRPPRVIEIALALSLALNIFVVGGFFYSQITNQPTPPAGLDHRLDLMANRLGIDAEKSKPFREFRTGLRRAFGGLAQSNRPLTDQLWHEVMKPDPDLAHLDELVDEIVANRQTVSRESVHLMVKFAATLTPDQRAVLLTLIQNRKETIVGPLRNAIGN